MYETGYALQGRDNDHRYFSYHKGNDFPFVDELTETSDDILGNYVVGENDGFEISKNINSINRYIRKKTGNESIYIQSFDDVNTDVDKLFGVKEQFEFNAILLYYSVYDQYDEIKTPYATNLYGIVFLDGMRQYEAGSDIYIINPLQKRKSTTENFGDSYTFRIRLDINEVSDNTDAIVYDKTSCTDVNKRDYDGVVESLNNAIDALNANTVVVAEVQDRYAGIVAHYRNIEGEYQSIKDVVDAYTKGNHIDKMDTSVMYVNTIKSDGCIEVTCGEHKMNIRNEETGRGVVESTDMTTSVLRSEYTYIKPTDTSVADVSINTEEDEVHVEAKKHIDVVLDEMFGSYAGITTKMKSKVRGNHMYIAPDSQMFSQDDVLKFMMNKNGVDYTSLIPYIILQLRYLHNVAFNGDDK